MWLETCHCYVQKVINELMCMTVMLNEVKTSRPDRGQFLEVEAKGEAKNNYEKKYQIMINNIWFKIIYVHFPCLSSTV